MHVDEENTKITNLLVPLEEGREKISFSGNQRYFESRPQTSSGAYIASSITRAILKAIRAGVGFGSGTNTTLFYTNNIFRCPENDNINLNGLSKYTGVH